MFSKFFKKQQPAARSLDHPSKLQKGDMIQMVDSFALPPQLKGQHLHVIGVNSYQYQYEKAFEFVLKGNDEQTVFLTIENDDGEEWANFSLKISRQDVDFLFDLDQFAEIFDDEALVSIQRCADAGPLERWSAAEYHQISQPYQGYFYDIDYRTGEMPTHVEGGGEPVECIDLADDDEKHYLSIEIWDDGETDVSLTLCRPISDIVDLFPGNN